jgi:6-phosphofructokinase 1
MAGQRVGILTGGGDAPGLNAVIRAVVRRGVDRYGYEILGIKKGWLGLLEDDMEPLNTAMISDLLPRGGTILKTSRTNPLKRPGGLEKLLQAVARHRLDALIAVGGEDTLGVAHALGAHGLKIVGVPKTIDNDLDATDYTFGFDTAVTIVTEAIDRLHTTAESHDRVIVVEVMGRHAGWIATVSGIAGGADAILIPEVPFDIDEVCALIKRRHERGRDFSIVVVAEGAKPSGAAFEVTQSDQTDEFGHVRLGGIGSTLAREIEKRTGMEARVTILGHTQRGGSPTAFDRVLATRFGVAAVDQVARGVFDTMVALQGTRIVAVPLGAAVAKIKTLDMELYEIARTFFG